MREGTAINLAMAVLACATRPVDSLSQDHVIIPEVYWRPELPCGALRPLYWFVRFQPARARKQAVFQDSCCHDPC